MAQRRRRAKLGPSIGGVNNAAAARDKGHPYRQISYLLEPQNLYSQDKIAAIHEAALRGLEELGIHFMLKEARDIFISAGASVTGDVVRIGRDMVAASLASCRPKMMLKAPHADYDRMFDQRSLLFTPAGGCPNVSDYERGRRAGDGLSFLEAVKLTQMMDVLHIQSVAPEPQDIPVHLRHIFMTQTQLSHCDKIMSIYARGRGQIMQNFEMIQTAMAIDDACFQANPHVMTVVNSNSPRIFDLPMAQAIIDFARYGQLSVITPFCLAGAMAPVTIEGALLLQHMECLAGITLSQLTKAGAPVSYGGFASNVDMRSGSPAFGTPEHVKMQMISGQLARYIGLPWRSAAGSASNMADAQGNLENTNALWGAMQGHANLVLHAAGWLEGGLTFGFEKFITDCEALQIIAELQSLDKEDEIDAALDAIAETEAGGHFFDNSHTMARYRDAFYEPLNADLTNYGTWQANGGQSADQRAFKKWQELLAAYQPSEAALQRRERLAPLAEKLTKNDGAAPLDG